MQTEQNVLDLVELGTASVETLGNLPGINEEFGTQKGTGISDAD